MQKVKPVCSLQLGCSGDSTDSTTYGDGVNKLPEVLLGKVESEMNCLGTVEPAP